MVTHWLGRRAWGFGALPKLCVSLHHKTLILGEEQWVSHAAQSWASHMLMYRPSLRDPSTLKCELTWVPLLQSSEHQLFIQTIIKDSYGQPLWATYYILDPVLATGIFFFLKHSWILSIFFHNSFINIILLIYFQLCWSLSLSLFSSMVVRASL